MSRRKHFILLSQKEWKLLELINQLGVCRSEDVCESLEEKVDYLVVIRMLHTLLEKGFLYRIIVNNQQLYRISRKYSYLKKFLKSVDT